MSIKLEIKFVKNKKSKNDTIDYFCLNIISNIIVMVFTNFVTTWGNGRLYRVFNLLIKRPRMTYF